MTVSTFLLAAPAAAAEPGPNVGIGKSARVGDATVDHVDAGTQFRYRIVVWNHGALPAENVTVVDDLDDDLIIESTFVEVNGQGPPAAHPCDVAAGNVLTCVLGTLAEENDEPGASEDSGFVRIVVTAPAAACGTVTNRATVSADDELPGRTGDNQSRLVEVDVVCPDVTNPAVSAPNATFAAKKRLGTAQAPLRIAWSGSDEGGSGIQQFRLQRRVNDGAWKDVELRRPRARKVILSLAFGKEYQFRVKARDGAGNLSAWKRGAPFDLIARQESSGAIDYTGRWPLRHPADAFGGALRQTGVAGREAAFGFTGRGIAWVSTVGPGYGEAEVWVDGSQVGTINLNRATKRTRMIAWRGFWGTSDPHEVTVVVVGTEGHPLVTVDAFAVIK